MKLQTKKTLDYYLGGLLMAFLKPCVWLLGLVLRRHHHLEVRRSLCVIKMLGGGSLVIAYPALLGLRRRYPSATLSLITTREILPFAETLNVFDRIDVIDDRLPLSTLWTGLGCLWRNFGVDTVIDLEVYSRLTTILSTLTAARNRIGFYLEAVFWRQRLHTHLIFFNRSSGSFHWYDAIARLLGAEPASVIACREHLRAHLGLPAAPARPAGRVAIGHSCSALAVERMLTPQQWATVFREHGAPAEAALFGIAGDRAAAEQIIAAVAPASPATRLENLCGELLLADTVRRMDSCGQFWGVDSALLHYARLLGLRCISYWGPTDPATRLRPVPGLEERTYYRRVACSPCVHVAETPPCHGQNICIKGLFGQAVPEEGATWLAWGQGNGDADREPGVSG